MPVIACGHSYPLQRCKNKARIPLVVLASVTTCSHLLLVVSHVYLARNLFLRLTGGRGRRKGGAGGGEDKAQSITAERRGVGGRVSVSAALTGAEGVAVASTFCLSGDILYSTQD